MLLTLSLKDFVLVDTLTLNFQNGFTVLTGETGAGKSVTLDALGLLLGDKADFSQIRHGAEEARLSALFDIETLPELRAWLAEQGLGAQDDSELVLRRIIDRRGKSRNFVNHSTATLAQLKHIGEHLVDIHGQNAHQSLNKEAVQRHLLDAFSGSLNAASATAAAYSRLRDAQTALDEAQAQSEYITQERERLQWQWQAFEDTAPEAGEWEQLSTRHDALAHAAQILQTAQDTADTLDGDSANLRARLFGLQQPLAALSRVEPRFGEALTLLESVDAELEEVVSLMHSVTSHADWEPDELSRAEERMQELMSLARKHKIEPEHLPQKMSEISDRLAALEQAADLDSLRQTLEKAQADYIQAASALSELRHAGAARLAEEVQAAMQTLAMIGARFEVAFQDIAPSAHGLEKIEYRVAVNAGTAPAPLAKTASGGELSRISLALQMVISQYTRVPTLIFDEVDSGIGGRVAEVVGQALRRLGSRYQVLAITHLPQVAAQGEAHWHVAKAVENGHTVSRITPLDSGSRIDEIARMLGGVNVTATTREHAAEMLAQAQDK